LPPPNTKTTRECRAKPTAKRRIGLNKNAKFHPDSPFQHINPACNFYLTKNQFYRLIFEFCEAFHGSYFVSLNIIRFLLLFSPLLALVTD
jgi:hypothetical protein